MQLYISSDYIVRQTIKQFIITYLLLQFIITYHQNKPQPLKTKWRYIDKMLHILKKKRTLITMLSLILRVITVPCDITYILCLIF